LKRKTMRGKREGKMKEDENVLVSIF
jgi:hypothetical protein